ncbi:MAG TPA: hypothetical protein VMU47_13175 [Caldimonas sp.]|nr:hypothetical protein [Caldimonas sp.]
MARPWLALVLISPVVTLAASAQTCARAATTAASAAGDPLQSDACLRALDALQAREASDRSSGASGPSSRTGPHDETRVRRDARAPRAPDPQLEARRREAAVACLANRPDPEARAQPQAPPSRFAQPPLAVPPVTLGVPSATTPPRSTPPTPILPLSPQAGPRPQFITSCDAGGCWANDGSRLNRVGPNLSAGSRGLCVQQGSLLTCP